MKVVDHTRSHRSILSWSIALMLSEPRGFVYACLRSVVMAPVPLFIKWVVDEALLGGDTQRIWAYAMISAGLIILHYPLAVYGAKRMGARLEKVIADFRAFIFNRIQYISFAYLDTAATGKLVSKYSFDTQRVHDSMLLIISQVVPNMVYSVGILTVLFAMNWGLSLVTILMLPIFYIARQGYIGRYKRRNHEARRAQEDLTGKAGELINSVRMVRSLGQDDAASEDVEKNNDAAAVTRFRVITATSHFGTFLFVSTQFLTLIVLSAGAWLVLQGNVTAGTLIAFVAAMPQILMPINIISQLMEQLIVGNESYRSIRELIDTRLVERWNGRLRLDKVRGEIELKDIKFSYPSKPDATILQDFNLHIKEGENVALVGESGSGKSTLTYLVLGLYEIQEGVISVDGHTLEELDVRRLRQQSAVVMQDNILLSGTISDNLRFAKPGATDEAIREAARLANADEFIQRLPDGYDTIIGERGAMLSGGQRQRISIARAILRDPAILILDEATSALDNHSEKLIQEALATLSKGRTVITIAHRLDTIRGADRIIVMDKGRIVDEGTYDSLSASSPHFQKLLFQKDPAEYAI